MSFPAVGPESLLGTGLVLWLAASRRTTRASNQAWAAEVPLPRHSLVTLLVVLSREHLARWTRTPEGASERAVLLATVLSDAVDSEARLPSRRRAVRHAFAAAVTTRAMDKTTGSDEAAALTLADTFTQGEPDEDPQTARDISVAFLIGLVDAVSKDLADRYSLTYEDQVVSLERHVIEAQAAAP